MIRQGRRMFVNRQLATLLDIRACRHRVCVVAVYAIAADCPKKVRTPHPYLALIRFVVCSLCELALQNTPYGEAAFSLCPWMV